MASALPAWWRLFRPHNAAIAGAGVWLGHAATDAEGLSTAAWGCLSMVLLTAAGNADNDVCDLQADRVNHPGRPLPSGALRPEAVNLAAFALYALGVAAAGLASALHGILAAGMLLSLLAYNRRFKAMPLLGNLVVSGLCATAIYFVEFPGFPQATLPACVFAFLATLAREIVKDLEDAAGDRAAGLRTYPLAAGESAARKSAFALVVALLALLPVPLAAFGYGWRYGILSAVLVAPFLLALILELSKPSARYARCQRWLKGLMVGGMAALWVEAAAR
jgi:geranylgeranylglycerol-phosphate geranylgeranyltransferase